MKKLLLIHPQTRLGAAGFAQSEAWHMPPLALGYVAALTPVEWEVRIVDEYVERLNPDEPANLVGISAYSANITRAYQIAALFRKRAVPVVMGGIHASMRPDEALQYADSVVVGEAESAWPRVIRDMENRALRQKYVGERLPLDKMPRPRRELFSNKYQMDTLIGSRGCPFGCEFCSVTAFNGAEYRQRPVNEILDELQTIEKDVVYFVDDNILGFGPRAEERAFGLFRGMVDRGIKKIWGTQASINVGDNGELLKCAFDSGCRAIYIGFESLKTENLKTMKKSVNLKIGVAGYRDRIKRIHDNGIAVVGAFMVGLDHDDPSVFGDIVAFMNDAGVDVFDLSYLTPYPGTALFDRLEREGRIICHNFPDDWDFCDGENVMVKPGAMSIVDLVRGFDFILGKRLRKRRVVGQFFKTLMSTKSPISALLSYNLNKGRMEEAAARRQ